MAGWGESGYRIGAVCTFEGCPEQPEVFTQTKLDGIAGGYGTDVLDSLGIVLIAEAHNVTVPSMFSGSLSCPARQVC
ncbi:hypothetical protein BH10CYA1_BH10CYA1_40140 [soil metagenome]